MPWSEHDLARMLAQGQVRLVGGALTPAPPLSEAAFQAAVIRLAKAAGYLVYFTKDSRRSPSGFPDLVLAHHVPGHPLCAVELKTDTGETTKAQEAWMAAIAGSTEVVTGMWRPHDIDTIMHRLRG